MLSEITEGVLSTLFDHYILGDVIFSMAFSIFWPIVKSFFVDVTDLSPGCFIYFCTGAFLTVASVVTWITFASFGAFYLVWGIGTAVLLSIFLVGMLLVALLGIAEPARRWGNGLFVGALIGIIFVSLRASISGETYSGDDPELYVLIFFIIQIQLGMFMSVVSR